MAIKQIQLLKTRTWPLGCLQEQRNKREYAFWIYICVELLEGINLNCCAYTQLVDYGLLQLRR